MQRGILRSFFKDDDSSFIHCFLHHFHLVIFYILPCSSRLSGYFKVCSLSLDVGLCSTFRFLPNYNLLLVAAHYKVLFLFSLFGLFFEICTLSFWFSDSFLSPLKTLRTLYFGCFKLVLISTMLLGSGGQAPGRSEFLPSSGF